LEADCLLRSRRAKFIKASDNTFASTGRIYGSNLLLVSNNNVSCKTGWVHICIEDPALIRHILMHIERRKALINRAARAPPDAQKTLLPI